jgi:hypothetical protein
MAMAVAAVLAAMSRFGHALIDRPEECSPFRDDWPCLLGLSRDN